MDADLIIVGNTYQCNSSLLVDNFVGTVEKLYDLSALVLITDFSKTDDERVHDLNKKMVIPFSDFNKEIA